MTIGSDLIARERARQIDEEGWDEAHDNEHEGGELARAAITYTLAAHPHEDPEEDDIQRRSWWPWEEHWWKPSADPVRNLVKAGALIAAEIDRLVRLDSGE